MATTSGLVNCVLVQSTTGYCEVRLSGGGGAIETFVAWSSGAPSRLHRMWVDLLSDAAANGKTVEITHAASSAQIDNVQLAGTVPNSVGNLLAWYRGDSLVGSPNITDWTDLGPNGRTLNTATGTPDDTIALNGHPTANFVPDENLYRDSAIPLAFPLHAFIVVRPVLYAVTNVPLYLGFSVADSTIPAFEFTNDNMAISAFDGGHLEAVPAGAPAQGDWALYHGVWTDNVNIKAAWNNGAYTSTAVGSLVGADGISLGGRVDADFATCGIAEFALYGDEISGADLTGLRNYFTDRYLL